MKHRILKHSILLSFSVVSALVAAPLPDEVREAVKQVRASDGVQPRQPFYLLEQALPKLAGDAEQRQQLAALLAEAAAAPDTPPAARTVLCQHLAKVAGEAEQQALKRLLAEAASAADARIALGEQAAAPAPAPSEGSCLAEAASPTAATITT